MEIWQIVLAVCGGIVTIGGAITYIKKAVEPARHVLKRIELQDKKLDNDNRRLNELEAGNRALCKAMLALLDHEITGNSVVSIKDARDTLNQYLINR